MLLADQVLKTFVEHVLQSEVSRERMGGSLRYLFNMVLLARFGLDFYERFQRCESLSADGMIETMAALRG